MALTLPKVALLASPLLGPAVWRSTAVKLADHGWDVLVVPGLDRAPGSPQVVLEHLRNVLPVEPPLALVAHSNAAGTSGSSERQSCTAASSSSRGSTASSDGSSSTACTQTRRRRAWSRTTPAGTSSPLAAGHSRNWQQSRGRTRAGHARRGVAARPAVATASPGTHPRA